MQTLPAMAGPSRPQASRGLATASAGLRWAGPPRQAGAPMQARRRDGTYFASTKMYSAPVGWITVCTRALSAASPM